MFTPKLDQDVNNQPSFSPTSVRKPKSSDMRMTFDKAMQAIIAGERVTKKEWDDPEIFGVMRDGFLKLIKHGVANVWLVSDGDLLGEDWAILID